MSVLHTPACSSLARTIRAAFYAALFLALSAIHLGLVSYAFDDAYIHVRIAEHLIAHGVPYFNPGEPVMASSSPLWTLLLGAVFAASHVDLRLVAIANAAATTACVYVYGTLIARSAGRPYLVMRGDVIAAVLMAPILAASSIGLMETPAALLTAGAGMVLIQRRRAAGFALLALAAFLRVELAALFIAFVVLALAGGCIRRLQAAAWAIVGAVPLLAYEMYFFGTVVPAAVRAKSTGYSLTLSETLSRVIPPWPVAGDNLVLLLMATLAVGAYVVFRSATDAAARAAYASGATIVLTYIGTRTLVFEWYIPLYAALITWPVVAAALRVRSQRGWLDDRVLCAAVVLVIALPAQIGFPQYVLGAAVNPSLAPTFAQGARVQSYIRLGQELYSRFPHATLLTSEIGGLGFGFRGRIADGFGLVSPAALKYHPLKVPEERVSGTLGAIPPAFVAETNPAVIVSYDIFAEAFLRSAVAERYVRIALPPFRARERVLAEAAAVPLELWGIQSLNVFLRRDEYDSRHADEITAVQTANR